MVIVTLKSYLNLWIDCFYRGEWTKLILTQHWPETFCSVMYFLCLTFFYCWCAIYCSSTGYQVDKLCCFSFLDGTMQNKFELLDSAWIMVGIVMFVNVSQIFPFLRCTCMISDYIGFLFLWKTYCIKKKVKNIKVYRFVKAAIMLLISCNKYMLFVLTEDTFSSNI